MSADPRVTPYEIAGGSAVVSAIATRFYDLMDSDPAYTELRAMHAADLAPVREGFARFLCGWMGGPRDWFDRGLCMMSLHRDMAIPPLPAAQWGHAMARAIADQPGLDPILAREMTVRLSQIATAMVNRPAAADAAA